VTWTAGLSANDLFLAPLEAPKRLKFSDCIHVRHEAPVNAVADDAPWRPVVEQLALALSNLPGPDKRIHIRLSNRWARWQLLPAQEHLTSDDDLASFAALQFLNVYGASSQHWQISHSPLRPGKNTPACAIEVALLDTLKEACAANGAKLESVQPYLSSAFDYWNDKIRDKAYWLAVVEPAYVCLLYVANRTWQTVRTQRQHISTASQLAAMTEQVRVAAGLPENRVPLWIAGSTPIELTAADSQANRLSLVGTVLREHPQFCLAAGL
jgi:hypothetical protein